MTPKIHLFYFPGACSLAPHILLEEIGVPYTTNRIDIKEGFPEELLYLNPKGQVPFLHLDSETITEVPAIITAIAQLAPSNRLLGKSNLDIVRSYEWMNYISGTLHRQAYGGWFRPHWFGDEPHYDMIRAKSKAKIAECYSHIDAKLDGKDWAVGDQFTATDAYLFVFYRWGSSIGFAMREMYPHYTRVMNKVVKRSAVTKVTAAEGISLFP